MRFAHIVPNIKISVYAKLQLCRCPTYHTKRAVVIRSLRRRPYRMKPTAVGFISLTTVNCDVKYAWWYIHSVLLRNEIFVGTQSTLDISSLKSPARTPNNSPASRAMRCSLWVHSLNKVLISIFRIVYSRYIPSRSIETLRYFTSTRPFTQ